MKKGYFRSIFIILIFFVVILYPWVMMNFGVEDNLSGVEERISIEDVNTTNIDKYIEQNFPGREFLVRLTNQIKVSLFKFESIGNLVLNGDVIFGTESLDYFLHGAHDMTNEEMNEFVLKLERLNTILKNKNKTLILTITPTKPRYRKEYTFSDELMNLFGSDSKVRPYDMFKNRTRYMDLNVFDYIDYINKHKEVELDRVPLYYDGSHHWAVYQANKLTMPLVKYIEKTANVDLMEISVKSTPSQIGGSYPDNDLVSLLNVFKKSKEQFYDPIVEYTSVESTYPNVLVRGGSFLAQLALPYVLIGLDNKVTILSNKICFYDRFSKQKEFDTYEELKLDKELKDYDIVMIEINELNFYNASFGFIDYLLENGDKF